MANPVRPCFHPREPITAGVRRIVRQLVDGALTLIARPTGVPDEDIHNVRVSIKRLRAFLLLIRPSIAQKSYERESARLRGAARCLAASRDLAVARKTLSALAKSAKGKRDREAFAQVLRCFHNTVAANEPMGRSKAFREVAAALTQSGKAILRLRLRAQDWEAVGPGLKEVYRAGRRRMIRAFAKDNHASFHRWRIRAKNLFYQLDTLAPVWPARLCKAIASLNKLQDCLGDDHDLAVVKSALETAPDAFGGACTIRRVIIRLDRESKELRKASRELGEEIFDQKPGRFVAEVRKHWRKWHKPARRSIRAGDLMSQPTHVETKVSELKPVRASASARKRPVAERSGTATAG